MAGFKEARRLNEQHARCLKPAASRLTNRNRALETHRLTFWRNTNMGERTMFPRNYCETARMATRSRANMSVQNRAVTRSTLAGSQRHSGWRPKSSAFHQPRALLEGFEPASYPLCRPGLGHDLRCRWKAIWRILLSISRCCQGLKGDPMGAGLGHCAAKV